MEHKKESIVPKFHDRFSQARNEDIHVGNLHGFGRKQ
jgi:hypothetical protein